MIVFRYLSREVLLTLSAVSAVLLVIIMSGRFVKYLAQAASGALDPGSLFLIMGFRLPGFLQLILPLGLFLGILLAYGRLYLESEMTVLSATGMSQQRLLGMTMAPAALVALLVAWLSLSLAPLGVAQVQQAVGAGGKAGAHHGLHVHGLGVMCAVITIYRGCALLTLVVSAC